MTPSPRPQYWGLGVGPAGYILLGFTDRHQLLQWLLTSSRDRREVVVHKRIVYSGMNAMDLNEFTAILVAHREPGEIQRFVLEWG